MSFEFEGITRCSGRGDLLVGYHHLHVISCLARVRELYTKPRLVGPIKRETNNK